MTSLLLNSQSKASYSKIESKNLKGNPYAESLNFIDYYHKLLDSTKKMIITDSDRNMPDSYRMDLLSDIGDTIFITNKHLEIFDMIRDLLKKGYKKRNPLTKEYVVELSRLGQEYRDKHYSYSDTQGFEYAQGTSQIMSIFGTPGVGKTITIESILGSYPKYIMHSKYHGKPFISLQIPLIRIKCPSDCSLTTICFDFFEAIDALAGTNYRAKFGYTTKDASGIINRMRAIGCLYGVGALVIDELQDLVDSNKDTDEVKTFISQLANKVGFPVILIGTINAYKLFTTSSSRRRIISGGEIRWDRMKYEDDDWNSFIGDLWELQVLKNKSELMPELAKALYNASQGIADYLKQVFIESQKIAIQTGLEELNVEIVEAALEKHPSIKEMTTAIMNNDSSPLSIMGDVVMTFSQEHSENKKNKEYVAALAKLQQDIQISREIHSGEMCDEIINLIRIAKIARNLSDMEIETIIKPLILDNEDEAKLVIIAKATEKVKTESDKRNTKIKQQKNKPQNKGLIKLVTDGKNDNPEDSNYDILKKSGFVKEDINV